MDLTLGGGDRRESLIGEFANPFRRAALLDDTPDVLDVPAMRLRRNLDVDLLADDLAANDFLNLHADIANAEHVREGAEPVGIQSHLKERAERHVAGDATERIEDRGAHQRILKTVGRTAAGVEDEHFGIEWDAILLDELPRDRERATTFGGGVDAARTRQLERRRTNGLFADRVGVPLALAQRAQDQAVATRAWNAQPARVRRRILPRRRLLFSGVECTHDRLTTIRLRNDHARHAAVRRQPSTVAQ